MTATLIRPKKISLTVNLDLAVRLKSIRHDHSIAYFVFPDLGAHFVHNPDRFQVQYCKTCYIKAPKARESLGFY